MCGIVYLLFEDPFPLTFNPLYPLFSSTISALIWEYHQTPAMLISNIPDAWILLNNLEEIDVFTRVDMYLSI